MGKKTLHSIALAGLALALTILFPEAAHATGAGGTVSFGQAICNMFLNSGYFPQVVYGICLALGIWYAWTGVMRLKAHADNPAQNKLHQAIMPLLISGMLVVLPKAIYAFILTIYARKAANDAWCQAGEAGTGGRMALDEMLIKFVENMQQPVIAMVAAIAFIFGIINIAKGLNKAAKYGQDPKAYSMHAITTNLVFGVIMVVLSQTLGLFMESIFGTDEISRFPGIAWADNNLVVSTRADAAIEAAITFLQLIGFLAFLRGWFLLKNSVEGVGQATMGQGFTHIIGGVICINMPLFLNAAELTFGVNFIN